MKLNLDKGLTAEYNRATMAVVLRDIQQAVNALAEGRQSGSYAATTTVPTTGTYAIGDFVKKSNPTEVGGEYVLYGWVCVASGTPGTWEECRFITADISGSPGSQGAQGIPGIHGLDGEDGRDGQTIPGPMGATGATGATGPAGVSGYPIFIEPEQPEEVISIPGPIGPQGAQGIQGVSGSSGATIFLAETEVNEPDIIPGPRGAAGADGADGGGSTIPYIQTSFTIPTGEGRIMVKRLQLQSTDRATIAGTARLRIT